MLVYAFHRIRALRLENKRLRHENRELRRRLQDANKCIKMQSDKNWNLYLWSRNAPREHQITEERQY